MVSWCPLPLSIKVATSVKHRLVLTCLSVCERYKCSHHFFHHPRLTRSSPVYMRWVFCPVAMFIVWEKLPRIGANFRLSYTQRTTAWHEIQNNIQSLHSICSLLMFVIKPVHQYDPGACVHSLAPGNTGLEPVLVLKSIHVHQVLRFCTVSWSLMKPRV